MLKAIVHRYINQIKSHDFPTYLHCRRVACISVVIGRKHSLDEPVLMSLQYAALLHDLGKVKIPRSVLNCADKLTDQEWEIIKQHPLEGTDIMRVEKLISKDVISGVLTHHERWNGKGYPCGLAGENIPLLARIISIADALDAMTSARPYRRRPLSLDEAISEIQSLSGQQFDPYIACSLGNCLFLKEVAQQNSFYFKF